MFAVSFLPAVVALFILLVVLLFPLLKEGSFLLIRQGSARRGLGVFIQQMQSLLCCLRVSVITHSVIILEIFTQFVVLFAALM